MEWNREYFRQYRANHTEKIRSHRTKSYLKNLDKVSKHRREYKVRNRDKISTQNKQINQKLKLRAHSIINGGNEISCRLCGLRDMNNLTLDHINGRDKDKIIDRLHGISLYRYVIKHPEEAAKCLQTLCNGCNQIKYTPKIIADKDKLAHYETDRKRRRRQKESVFSLITKGFPIECVKCAQNDINNLTADRINHRDSGDEFRGTNLYRYMLIHPEIAFQYQILCFGCNTAKAGTNRATKLVTI